MDPLTTGQSWRASPRAAAHPGAQIVLGQRPGLLASASHHPSEGLEPCWAHKRFLIKSGNFLTFLYLHPKQTYDSDRWKLEPCNSLLSNKPNVILVLLTLALQPLEPHYCVGNSRLLAEVPEALPSLDVAVSLGCGIKN